MLILQIGILLYGALLGAAVFAALTMPKVKTQTTKPEELKEDPKQIDYFNEGFEIAVQMIEKFNDKEIAVGVLKRNANIGGDLPREYYNGIHAAVEKHLTTKPEEPSTMSSGQDDWQEMERNAIATKRDTGLDLRVAIRTLCRNPTNRNMLRAFDLVDQLEKELKEQSEKES